MINFKDMPDGEPIYTYVDEDGANIHIASDRLRQWCLTAKPEIFLAPVNQELAETFIPNNLISPDRLVSLTFQIIMDGQLEPVIFCKVGTLDKNGNPDVVLADGHHRYYLQRKAQHILAHVLEQSEWEPFKIEGHPTVTQEELISAPVRMREYW